MPSAPRGVWRELEALRVSPRALADATAIVYLDLRDGHALHSAVLEAYQNDKRIVLRPVSDDDMPAEVRAARAGAGLVVSASGNGSELRTTSTDVPPDARPPGIGIFTSGTTGEPKLAWHTWASIAGPAARAQTRLQAARWLMAYAPSSYAAMQVLFAATAGEGIVVYPDALINVPHTIVGARVDAISATPTWWRALAISWPEELSYPNLRQATLGGERATQDVLDLVSRQFRPQRMTHVYASTEVGSALAVSDRREGFPAAWLQGGGEVQLRIREGILEIRTPHRMLGYIGRDQAPTIEGWSITPDYAELRGDRIVITGRADGVLNIGGRKVSPEVLEERILAADARVIDCCVYAKPSPITGFVLAADLVLVPGADPNHVRASLRTHISNEALPGVLRVVKALTQAPSGKKARTAP